MKNWMKNKFDSFFLTPSTGEPLSALRIVVGLMMFVKATFLFPHIDDLYGQYGYLQARLMEAIVEGNITSWSLNHGVTPDQYSTGLHVFFIVHMMAALSFMAGFRTRLSNFVLWATQSMLFQLAWVSAYGIDAYCQNLCFIMLFLPVARFWSIDAKLKVQELSPTAVCTVGLRVLQIYLLLTYVDAGVSKGMGHDWWNGHAIWEVLHLPEFNHLNFFWMAEYQWVPKILGIGTVILEAGYIVGVWIPHIGRLWAFSIVMMHVVIASLMGLVLFGITLALINSVLFLYPVLAQLRERAPAWRLAPVRA